MSVIQELGSDAEEPVGSGPTRKEPPTDKHDDRVHPPRALEDHDDDDRTSTPLPKKVRRKLVLDSVDVSRSVRPAKPVPRLITASPAEPPRKVEPPPPTRKSGRVRQEDLVDDDRLPIMSKSEYVRRRSVGDHVLAEFGRQQTSPYMVSPVILME